MSVVFFVPGFLKIKLFGDAEKMIFVLFTTL